MKIGMILFTLLFSFYSLCAEKNIDADIYLKKSDFYRGNFTGGFSWNVTVTSQEDDEAQTREFQVYSKGNNSKALALSPKRNKGEVYLFNDRLMWFNKPGLKKPISISPRQRLSGQAANGDVATTHYARDYAPVFEKLDKVNNESVVVLLLTSKDKNTTYDKIRYYVSQKSYRAVRADFLSLQGALLKTAYFEYQNAISVEGKEEFIVSKMTIFDSFNKENKSELIYTLPKIETISESVFNVNNLGK